MDIIFEIQEEKHLKLSEYLNQIWDLLAFLSASYDFASRGFSPRPHEGFTASLEPQLQR